jgi:glycogen synthase
MNILLISTEAEPFAKTGGLGDVIGSLPRELNKQGADARVMLPLYQGIRQQYQSQMEFMGEFHLMLSWRTQYCGIFRLESDGVVFYFLDNEHISEEMHTMAIMTTENDLLIIPRRLSKRFHSWIFHRTSFTAASGRLRWSLST